MAPMIEYSDDEAASAINAAIQQASAVLTEDELQVLKARLSAILYPAPVSEAERLLPSSFTGGREYTKVEQIAVATDLKRFWRMRLMR